MSRTLNLGILAHVDAGKTTLTERLLYAAGVIDRLGSVDSGTTQTDSLALERARGITIRSAVASLRIGDRDVNIIDTPGHPDFIAEVDRVLAVLDGAVLVVSAVEGVQPQTRLLMRALRRLGVPTLIFVNKVDRGGADLDRVLEQIERRLAVPAVPMCGVRGAGTRSARVEPDDERVIDVLTTRDDGLLAAYLSDSASVEPQRLRSVLADLTASRHAVPVFAGSAITGAGIADLMGGLADLLPTAAGDPAAPASGRIFKVERGRAGEKIAYLRMFDGVLRLRDHPTGGRDRITGLAMLDRGGWRPRPQVEAGQIARVHGLAGSRVGDLVGDLVVTPRSSSGPAPPRRRLAAFSSVERRPGIPPSSALRGIHLDDAGPSTNFWAQPPVGVAASAHGGSVGQFAPPMLEALVVPLDPHEGAKLRTALTQLGEQDPLINVRADEVGTAVSLFGEVQKEVIGATLAEEFGLAVRFEETTALCVERPAGVGEAIERLNTPTNPHQATIGLRIEPGPADSGIDVRIEVDYRSVPLYAYRTVEIFTDYLDGYVREALQTGPSGWPVTDCVVTLTESGYSVADGPPSLRGPTTTTADVRKLTALVLADAVADAGTVVCEPLARVSLDIPAGSLSAVLGALSRLAAVVEDQLPHGEEMLVVGVLTAADSQRLHRMLPGLTGGEGVLESTFAGYRPVRGRPRVRR